MPPGLKMFPHYLREAGYYTTNNRKEDYNLIKSPGVWDESSKDATWKNRSPGQPFFHVQNITLTHESSLHFSRERMAEYKPKNPVADAFVLPNHPQTDLFRYTNAYYRDRIQMMDNRLGEIVRELEKDGLMDNTIIFYYGDHGGVLPGSKGYLNETGLHVPMVVYVPPKYRKQLDVKAGTEVSGFVNFIDLGPTVLSLAGLEIPDEMDGRPFLGADIKRSEVNQRDETYSYADRFDEKYDLVRAVRKGNYKYIRSFQPFNADGLMNNYRYRMLAYQEWDSLYRAGELNDVQSAFFESRPAELLYDLDADPYETINLAGDPAHEDMLQELRNRLYNWMSSMPDLSLYPEYVLVNQALENPAAFGQQHKKEIQQYLEIANLCLHNLDHVKSKFNKALQSQHPWQRYWALIAATSMDETNNSLIQSAEAISSSDPVPLNRMQSALLLALKKGTDPVPVLTEALYAARYPAEGLHILNSIVLMQDFYQYSNFHIELDKLHKSVREEPQVQRRLEYLGLM